MRRFECPILPVDPEAEELVDRLVEERVQGHGTKLPRRSPHQAQWLWTSCPPREWWPRA